jgi:hypothetical protein
VIRFAVEITLSEQMKTEAQYVEGQEARKNFEQTMTTLFRAPKPTPRKQREKPTTRKSKKADKD